jgi:exodeoxyribonuclease VII large subunit
MLDLTVSQVLKHIDALFGIDEILSEVIVMGEVSRITNAASGHSYFTLKDEDAVLDGVMFKRGIGAEHLLIGEMVRVFGKVSVYKPAGRMQIISDIIQPAGIGLLQSQIDDLKIKLEFEGLFDISRKRALPAYPVKIGVVTSEDAAAWEDIKKTIANKFPMTELILSHTLVQGYKSPPMISKAIEDLAKLSNIDVIILARGGGSPEDLLPFSDELVARAIFASPVPVVTGIGHENDWSIADLVADVRASTPTAAASSVVPDAGELNEIIRFNQITLFNHLTTLNNQLEATLQTIVYNLNSNLPDLDNAKLKLDDLTLRLKSLTDYLFTIQRDRYKRIYDNLKIMSPQATLERGYSITHRYSDNKLILRKSDIVPGDMLNITVSDGNFDVVVDK